MKGHHLGLLIVAAVLAIVAAFWTTSIREPAVSGGETGNALFPDLAGQLNSVTGVKLTGPGNTTIATLNRSDTVWTLAEKYDHPANIAELRELLLQLSQARLLEEKTSNPEYYERLGVQDIASADAAGVLVELEGVAMPAVIIGDTVAAREAVYVRPAGEAASWLAGGSIVIASETMQWLDREALDINVSKIAEIEITHPDGHKLRAHKIKFGQPDFEVADIPAGRELQSDNIANAIASAIQNLQVDDVAPFGDSEFASLSTTQVVYRAFDGQVITAVLAAKDDKHYVHFSVSVDAATAQRFLPVTEPSADDAGEQGPPPQPEADLTAVSAEAEKMNARLVNWVYELPKARYDQMSKRLDDLLKDPN